MTHFPFDRGFLWLLLACSGTLLILPACIRLAPIIGALDDPLQDSRRIHSNLTPRIGGLAVAAVFAAMFLLLPHGCPSGPGFIVGILILTVVGLLDDTKGVSPRVKMLGHIMAMLSAVLYSNLVLPDIPIPLFSESPITNPVLCILITTLVGVGLINAMNLIDGLDGLAAGLGSIAAGGIAVLAAMAGNTDLCLSSLLLVGCLAAILAFNSHPARIFLGDTGSMLIGYLLACFSINLVITPNNTGSASYSPFLPLMLVAVPCADCLWVMMSRMAKGKNAFSGDKNHVHHHILSLGLRHSHAVMLILGISVIITLIAIGMRHRSDDIIALTIICTIQSVVGGVRFLVRAPAYRRLAFKAIRLQRGYKNLTTPILGTSENKIHKWMLRISRFALQGSFIGLFTIYAIAGLRPSSLMGLIAVTCLGLIGIVYFSIKNTKHHFMFIAIFLTGTFLALGSDLWAKIDHNLTIIGLMRILLLLSFSGAVLSLWLNRRLSQLIGTPLELVILGIGVGLVLIATERGNFNVPAVAASSIALFVVLKSMFLDETAIKLPICIVLISLVIFIIFQAAIIGKINYKNKSHINFVNLIFQNSILETRDKN